MISVRFLRDRGHYYYFESRGHADYADKGEDIVCAAVSALAFTLVNGILECYPGEPIIDHSEEGVLSLELNREDSEWLDTEIQRVFKTINIGMQGIVETYGDFVELLNEEV
ncbi:MAG: hypothetical protein AVO33_08790 [delta proteobacterium ML8_F1]|nr:MAG: hypothetical protein AVO33_08790 [delta proteobacterium ML8_F1]